MKGILSTHLNNIESGIDIQGHLLVLKELVSETTNPTNTHSVILQHVLPTIVEYIDLVNKVYPVDLIIAIAYSVDLPTVELLRAKGYNVYIPADINDMLNNLWKPVTALLKKNSYPLMIQEVGGYFSRWTKELGEFKNFVGCVEDTNNGLWLYQSVEKLFVPVISMADTPLKHVEDAMVGDACVYSLEKVMRSQMSCSLQGIRCGVIGWGHIGKSAAAAFGGRHSIVSVYDINPIVNMLAYAEGYYPMPLKKMLGEVDILIGCSGRRSVRVSDIPDLKDGIILCSGASKDVEFDLKGFAEVCDIEDVEKGGAGKCPIQKYTVKETGKKFYVLKNGTPIDFLDMALQGAILDCTCSELFACMKELATNPHAAGIIPLTDKLQILVAQKWLKIHSEVFSLTIAESDKAFSFPESWDWQ
jgi:adenosylhomocysteinase